MEFPRYENAVRIGVDIETRDDTLLDKGMGAVRDGYIAGVAVGAEFADGSRHAVYLPVAHEGGGNLDRGAVWSYLNDTLSNPHIPKVGTNLQYDLSFLWSEGVRVAGPFHDITIAQPLLNENQRSYSLESQSQARLGRGKADADMEDFIRKTYGIKAGREKSAIWKCPAHIVAPYAEQDVLLPLEIIAQQVRELEADEMADLWQMECDLLPILVRMHLNGVRVNVPYAQQLYDEWTVLLAELEGKGQGINPQSSKQIAAELDRLGVQYPINPKTGNPILNKKVIEGLVDQAEFLRVMQDAKKYAKFRDTFLQSYIIDSHICGRVHGQFNQLKGDEYGTVTGRLSASNPNLQNIPNPEKDPYFSARIRGLYLPEHGQRWLRFDFSQIEYRLLIHFASGLPGGVADLARQMYAENPDTDFHQMCAAITGLDVRFGPKVGRKYAKNINFGLVYGMGVPKLAASLGLSVSEAREIFEVYHARAPFAKAFMEEASRRAQNRGFIRTIGKRKRRFDMWEPARYIPQEEKDENPDVKYLFTDQKEAMDAWGRVKRAHTHAAANAVLQGSSADITKRAMVEGHKRGIYDVLGYPLVTVHDELGFSYDPSRADHREAAREMEDIMINAFPLKVPVLVGREMGDSWGACEEFEWENA